MRYMTINKTTVDRSVWHYEKADGTTYCGTVRCGLNFTQNVKYVNCKSCLSKMREDGIIDERDNNASEQDAST
jgi:hypothetical protein